MTLYDKLSSTTIPNPNATLTYNFNKVMFAGLNTTDARSANIDVSFPGYSNFIKNNSNNNQLLMTLKTIPSSNNITYYDTIINSTKLYKINYIHVGISPLNLNNIYSWCVMLDLSTTALDTLIIIIPIKYVPLLPTIAESVVKQKENPDFSKLIYNCNYSTNNEININSFILPNNYITTYNSASSNSSSPTSRVIILNGSINTYFYDIINSSRTTLNPKYINNIYLNSTVYNPNSAIIKNIPLSNIYLCTKLPIKTNDILKNDIYIDCYKVGESTNVIGGITNPSSVSRNRTRNQETQIALFSIIIAFVMLYGFFKLYQMFNTPTAPINPVSTSAGD
jgi:hypothetical protein